MKENVLATAGTTVTSKKHQTYDSTSIAVLEGREAVRVLNMIVDKLHQNEMQNQEAVGA